LRACLPSLAQASIGNTKPERKYMDGSGKDQPLSRINVVGVSGSGKTNYASKLAQRLGVPHIELDALHWEPGWQPASLETFREKVREAVSAPTWALDGNYSKVRDIVWARAEQIIWLDYPLGTIMRRLLLRTFRRVAFRQELWNSNRETVKGLFQKDNILSWALTTYSRRKRNYPLLFARPEFAHLSVVRFSSPREANEWIERFPYANSRFEQIEGG
jgi:adenylate kinase family enzyme